MNLPKFKVVGDPKNPARFSSSIIINALNEAAKKIDLYDENGLTVVYDCIGNSHGYKADAFITCYELKFPNIILHNCRNKPIIAVSRDNMRFAIEGGHPPELCNYINLGVDSNVWTPVTKKQHLDKFVVLSYTESLVRSGLEILVESFKMAFDNDKDVLLYIKDRNATPEFQEWVFERCKELNVPLKYSNRHVCTPEEEMQIFSEADCHAYLNRSTTWGMTVCQSMTCGLPTLSPAYSGPREYLIDYFSGLTCEYSHGPIIHEIDYLQSIGQRSYFFPLSVDDYWCVPSKESVAEKLVLLKKHANLRNKLKLGGISMGKSLTWERSALMLSESLSKFYK